MFYLAKFLLTIILILPNIVFATETIDINIATLTQLDELTGIGSTYAQRIIDSRPYSSLDDLLNVKGIGPATLQKIKDQGLACVSCDAPQDPTTIDNYEAVNNTTANQTPTIESEDIPSEPAGTVSHPSGIFISEILPSPKGADETEEWVELQNTNNFDVDISGWKIKDFKGSTKEYILPNGSIIAEYGFLILKRPQTKIMMNNDEDKIILYYADNTEADSVYYTKAKTGLSYNKNNNSWFWTAAITPGFKNTTQAPLTEDKNLPKEVKNDNNKKETELYQIGLNQETSSNENPWFLFFTALFITIISASLILFIKIKLKGQQDLVA